MVAVKKQFILMLLVLVSLNFAYCNYTLTQTNFTGGHGIWLTVPNATYCMGEDVNVDISAPFGSNFNQIIKINAYNITLDCQGHLLNQTNIGQHGEGVASYNTGDYATVRNCVINAFYPIVALADFMVAYNNTFNGTQYNNDAVSLCGNNATFYNNTIINSHTDSNIVYICTENMGGAIGCGFNKTLDYCTGNVFANNTIRSVTLSSGNFAFRIEGGSQAYNYFYGNNVSANHWVNDATGNSLNFFNVSGVGNKWYFVDGTGAWNTYPTYTTTPPNYADNATGVPYGSSLSGGEWAGNAVDYHPWTALSSGTPAVVGNCTPLTCHYYMPINCTNMASTIPALINGTYGFTFPSSSRKQFVRIQCIGNPILYFDNESSWTIANSTTTFPYVSVNSTHASSNPLSVYDPLLVDDAYSFEGNGYDEAWDNNLSNYGTPAYTTGYVGLALSVPHTANFLQKSSGATSRIWAGNADNTFCSVVKLTTIDSTANELAYFGKWDGNGHGAQYGVVTGGGNPDRWLAEKYNFDYYPNVTTAGMAGRWLQVCFTYNGTNHNVSVYVNGVLNSSQVRTDDLALVRYAIKFGQSFDGSQKMNGLLDEAILYNKSITATEESSIYNNYLATTGYATLDQMGSNFGALTVNYTSGGTATGSNGSFPIPSTLPISATANSGYYFSSWNTNCNGAIANILSATTTITINDGIACYAQANFLPYGNFVVNWTAGGTASGSSNAYTTPATLPITATPTPRYYTFSSWTSNCSGSIADPTSATTTITITDNLPCYAQANFLPIAVSVAYTNYSIPNVTGIGQAFDYSQGTITTATGNSDMFGLSILGTIFICFYLIGSRYTQERALVYSTFMITVVAFLMVSGNFLDPKWLILCVIALIASVYLANRLG